MKKERNSYLDILKGISILLVITGHSIQYGSGMEYLSWGSFLYNPVFIFIYSFHMPLFMLISGYLFSYSCRNKTCKELLLAKAKQILIPLFCWSFISLLVHIIKIINGVSAIKISIIWIIQTILSGFWGGPWFLWAIWWCSFLIIIGKRFFKDKLYFYLLIFFIVLLTPDENNSAVYKFMWPFYFIAYYFNTYDYKTKLKKIYSHKAFSLSCLIIFSILLRSYGFDSYIYTSGYTILNKNILYQLHSNSFRFFIGMVGSLSVIFVVQAFMDIIPNKINQIFSYIGKHTLGIYLISNYFFDEILKWLPIAGLNYWYTFLEVICVLGVSLLITVILKKFKITNQLFLGAR